jgi:hypothetical protein
MASTIFLVFPALIFLLHAPYAPRDLREQSTIQSSRSCPDEPGHNALTPHHSHPVKIELNATEKSTEMCRIGTGPTPLLFILSFRRHRLFSR